MAKKSVAKYEISADDVALLQEMLLDAIKAKNELRNLSKNIDIAVNRGLSASILSAFKAKPVELDITDAAEMIHVLNALTAVQDAPR